MASSVQGMKHCILINMTVVAFFRASNELVELNFVLVCTFQYEHMVLLDLIKKGHSEPDKKIGGGIKTFQIRTHPMWKSRCFFLVREDDTADDFSFRKCVDHILPLPENMIPGANGNGHGGGGRGGGRRGGRGGGKGGRFRR